MQNLACGTHRFGSFAKMVCPIRRCLVPTLCRRLAATFSGAGVNLGEGFVELQLYRRAICFSASVTYLRRHVRHVLSASAFMSRTAAFPLSILVSEDLGNPEVLRALVMPLPTYLKACNVGSTFSPSSFLPSGGRYPISGGGSYTASPDSQFA